MLSAFADFHVFLIGNLTSNGEEGFGAFQSVFLIVFDKEPERKEVKGKKIKGREGK